MGRPNKVNTRESESQTNGIANTKKCGGIFPGEKWLDRKIREATQELSTRFQEHIGDLQNEVTALKTTIDQIEKENDTLNDLQQVSETALEQLQSDVKQLQEEKRKTNMK